MASLKFSFDGERRPERGSCCWPAMNSRYRSQIPYYNPLSFFCVNQRRYPVKSGPAEKRDENLPPVTTAYAENMKTQDETMAENMKAPDGTMAENMEAQDGTIAENMQAQDRTIEENPANEKMNAGKEDKTAKENKTVKEKMTTEEVYYIPREQVFRVKAVGENRDEEIKVNTSEVIINRLNVAESGLTTIMKQVETAGSIIDEMIYKMDSIISILEIIKRNEDRRIKGTVAKATVTKTEKDYIDELLELLQSPALHNILRQVLVSFPVK